MPLILPSQSLTPCSAKQRVRTYRNSGTPQSTADERRFQRRVHLLRKRWTLEWFQTTTILCYFQVDLSMRKKTFMMHAMQNLKKKHEVRKSSLTRALQEYTMLSNFATLQFTSSPSFLPHKLHVNYSCLQVLPVSVSYIVQVQIEIIM